MTVPITPHTIYDGRDLSSGYTWDVDLTNSYFYGCNLSGVDLSQVTSFKGCEFYWCNMTGTKFTSLDLRNLNYGSGPTLQWCNLTSADFTSANLSYVNLTGNTLTGVIISGATTTGTIGLIGVGAVNITGPPVAGYNTWFHADSLTTTTPVPQLTDVTSNANHAVQSTPGNRGTYHASAVNGLAAVAFDGTNAWYETTNSVTCGTLFVVCNHTDGATFTTYRRILDGTTGGWSFYAAPGAADYVIGGGITASNFRVNGAITLSGGTLSSYRVISLTVDTPATSKVAVSEVLGTETSGQRLAGNIAEYLIYPTIRSAGDRHLVEAYFGTRYNISMSVS